MFFSRAQRLRFYKWLKGWAADKERKADLENRFSTLCCPHCNTWDSNMPNRRWEGMNANTPTMQHDQFKCGQCGQWSTWLDAGIIRVLDDPAFPDKRPKMVEVKPKNDKGISA